MKHRQVRIKGAGVVNRDGHTVGIDIGATSVRAAVLTQGTLDGRASVTSAGAGTVALEPGVVVNGVVQEPSAVTAALKQLWHDGKFECRNVIVGIANPQVLVRDVTVPDLNPQQRAKALPFQAREVVAFPDRGGRARLLPARRPRPGDRLIHGLLVAAPREPVLAAVRAVERAGLHVARVDLSALGVAARDRQRATASRPSSIIGAHLTTDRHPRPRRAEAGPHHGTRWRADDRRAVRPARHDAGGRRGPQAGRGPAQTAHEFNRALADALRPLMAEIRTSIQYFRTMNDNAGVDRMSITGGRRTCAGLAELMTEQIGLPVREIDPLQHVRNRHASRSVTDPAAQHASAVAVGLAMGAAA